MITHDFRPKKYYNTLGAHEPVLSIRPGDRVVTTTVDASGQDENREVVTAGGNPQTGPFYIEGAAPGDVLVVRLERIVPSRDTGWSSSTLAGNVVNPEFVNQLYRFPPDAPWDPSIWDLDRVALTATLRTSTQAAKLGAFSLPLAPMLGCFGVAPDGGQYISTATSAEHGGNMDYRGFSAGTTVYLPVFVEGALFFLGDGHAVQGDGEIAGTGIETSMEVEFSVDVRKGQPIGWPRGENEFEIFTVGNARPLDQALQHATTEMMRWLQSEHNLDSLSAGIFLGQTVRYEIGNVFDPAYTVVCKVQKGLLSQLPR